MLWSAVKKKRRRWKVTKTQTLFSRNSRSSKDKKLHPHSTYMRTCYPKGGICRGSSQVDLNQDVKNSQVGTDSIGREEDKVHPKKGGQCETRDGSRGSPGCLSIPVRCAVLSHSVMSNSLWPPWTVPRQAPLSMGILHARILEWVAMPSS